MKRRDFMLASAAAGVSLASGCQSKSRPVQETDETITAEQALNELIEGNSRFVSGKSKHPRADESWLSRLTKGQKPIATILACSDSRVPLELLFDQGFGDLFAIRVAGNIVSRYGIGSIEYAQHHLSTPLFVVLGHESCGAVTAAMLPQEKRKKEPKAVQELLDAVHIGEVDPNKNAKRQLAAAVEANARYSAKQLMEVDPKKRDSK